MCRIAGRFWRPTLSWNEKRRSTQLRPGTGCRMNFSENKKAECSYGIFRSYKNTLHGPSGESRTHGLLNPIQARYQTALHPDVTHCDGYYYTPLNCQMSTFSFTKMQNDCFVPPGWAILNAYNSRFNLSANPPVRHSAVFSKFADFSVHKKAIDLSINGFWSEWRESNSRPLEPHSSALPNCATPGCHSKRQVLL